jgi:hypothetical protein
MFSIPGVTIVAIKTFIFPGGWDFNIFPIIIIKIRFIPLQIIADGEFPCTFKIYFCFKFIVIVIIIMVYTAGIKGENGDREQN